MARLLSLPALRGALGRAWTRWQLRSCDAVGPGCQVLGRVWIHGGGTFHLGSNVVLDGRAAPIELKCHPGASIRLGDEVRIDGGTSLEARQSIVVGAGARLEAFVKVIDNHFHQTGDRRRPPPSVAVTIGPGARLCARAIALPGAYLEPGGVVPPGTVVSKRVPGGKPSTGA